MTLQPSGDLKQLGEQMKAVRRLKGLSLSGVASPAKISPAYVQKLELGTVKNPSPRVLHRVAGVLELSYATMMELAGYYMPSPGHEAQTGGKTLLVEALEGEQLSEEEQKAVAAFVLYLKAQRGQQ